MANQNMNLETTGGILGGSLSSILGSLTIGDITNTIILGAVGTIVSFFVSMLLKKLLKKKNSK